MVSLATPPLLVLLVEGAQGKEVVGGGWLGEGQRWGSPGELEQQRFWVWSSVASFLSQLPSQSSLCRFWQEKKFEGPPLGRHRPDVTARHKITALNSTCMHVREIDASVICMILILSKFQQR